MQIDAPPKPEKTYVTVLASIDQTGLMEPREIIWPDGRKFPIDRVECWRKARDHGPETTYYVIEIGAGNGSCILPKARYAALSIWAGGMWNPRISKSQLSSARSCSMTISIIFFPAYSK